MGALQGGGFKLFAGFIAQHGGKLDAVDPDFADFQLFGLGRVAVFGRAVCAARLTGEIGVADDGLVNELARNRVVHQLGIAADRQRIGLVHQLAHHAVQVADLRAKHHRGVGVRVQAPIGHALAVAFGNDLVSTRHRGRRRRLAAALHQALGVVQQDIKQGGHGGSLS